MDDLEKHLRYLELKRHIELAQVILVNDRIVWGEDLCVALKASGNADRDVKTLHIRWPSETFDQAVAEIRDIKGQRHRLGEVTGMSRI